jgi:hypothetical protein
MGGGSAALVIKLTNNGNVTFADFIAPTTQLYLNLVSGTATGQIAVKALQVDYAGQGTQSLVGLHGSVNGASGSSAASASFIQPQPKNNYQVNGCPIQSVNCIRIADLTPPIINPLQDLLVSAPPEPDDFFVTLPDVGEKDY